jgi:hypothetical protein
MGKEVFKECIAIECKKRHYNTTECKSKKIVDTPKTGDSYSPLV